MVGQRLGSAGEESLGPSSFARGSRRAPGGSGRSLGSSIARFRAVPRYPLKPGYPADNGRGFDELLRSLRLDRGTPHRNPRERAPRNARAAVWR